MKDKSAKKYTLNDSDEAIVASVVNGDVDAYAEIMNRYESKLHRYATYLMHDPMTAHDIVQDTFIKTYQNLQGFNPKYKFSSWIYRIAHNESMNALKRNKHVTDDDINNIPELSYDPRIDEIIDKNILKENVHKCLASLDSKYREVVQLVYLEDMKYEDVSDVLHIPTSTVGVRLSRAKDKLREICKKKGVKR